MMSKISIIIPVYNAESYISRCIDSVIAQSYKDWELILVDDGSTDESGKICDEYAEKDERIRVFHKKNGGVSSARNVGLDNATGEWVAFIDADDCVLAGWLQCLADTIVNNDADMFMWGIQIGDDCRDVKFKVQPEEKVFANATEFIVSKSYRYNPVLYLFERELINKYNCRFPDGIKLSEDQCFILQYLCHNPRIVTIPQIFYHYIHNPYSAIFVNRTSMNYADNIKVARIFADYSCEYNDVDIVFVNHAVCRLFSDFFVCITQQDRKDYDENVQSVYNICYDEIMKLYPSSLKKIEFKIARYNLLYGIFYWNHKNGFKARFHILK